MSRAARGIPRITATIRRMWWVTTNTVSALAAIPMKNYAAEVASAGGECGNTPAVVSAPATIISPRIGTPTSPTALTTCHPTNPAPTISTGIIKRLGHTLTITTTTGGLSEAPIAPLKMASTRRLSGAAGEI